MLREVPMIVGGAHVLVVDHDDMDAMRLGSYLEAQGCVVDYAQDGLTGLQLIESRSYDAVVIEFSIPGLDARSFCRHIRAGASAEIPVLVCSAQAHESDVLESFDSGADDFVAKPIPLAAFRARLRVLLRRTCRAGSTLRVGDLHFDTRTLVVRRCGRRIELGPSGLRLLEKLMRASPAVVSRTEIERLLWGDDPPENDGCLRSHVHALRSAIDGSEPEKLVHTIHGLGYRVALAREG